MYNGLWNWLSTNDMVYRKSTPKCDETSKLFFFGAISGGSRTLALYDTILFAWENGKDAQGQDLANPVDRLLASEVRDVLISGVPGRIVAEELTQRAQIITGFKLTHY